MISYEPLFHTLVKKGMKQTDLLKAGLSSTIIAKFKKNQHVNTATLDKICQYLNCTFNDIIESLPDKPEQPPQQS